MENRIAKIISTILNPLFIPTIGLLILFNLNTFIAYLPLKVKCIVLLIVFINTAIIPFLLLIFLKKFGIIDDINLHKRNQRIYPLIAGALLYYFTFYVLNNANLPSLINFYFLSATFLIIISLLVSLKWKISLHMISIGGLTGLFIITAVLFRIDISLIIIITILVSGLLGSSRLKLNLHSSSQVYAGYLTGLILMLLMYHIFRGY